MLALRGRWSDADHLELAVERYRLRFVARWCVAEVDAIARVSHRAITWLTMSELRARYRVRLVCIGDERGTRVEIWEQ